MARRYVFEFYGVRSGVAYFEVVGRKYKRFLCKEKSRHRTRDNRLAVRKRWL